MYDLYDTMIAYTLCFKFKRLFEWKGKKLGEFSHCKEALECRFSYDAMRYGMDMKQCDV